MSRYLYIGARLRTWEFSLTPFVASMCLQINSLSLHKLVGNYLFYGHGAREATGEATHGDPGWVLLMELPGDE